MSIKLKLDFKTHLTTLILALVILISPIIIAITPLTLTFENGIIENLQVFILLFGIIFCFFQKNKFFNFIAMILFILILREINFGRVFFPRPEHIGSFLHYNEIKYGWILKYGGYLFILYTGLYFIINKLYLTTIKYLKKSIPIIDLSILILCMIIGTIAEPYEFVITEEIFETIFYISLINLIYLYSKYKLD